MSDEVKEIINAFLAWVAIAAFVCVIFFFAIISAPASAADKQTAKVLYLNQSTRIVLMDAKCPLPNTQVAIAQKIDGKTYMRGCYSYNLNTGMFHIQWSRDDKDFSELPALSFETVELVPGTETPQQDKHGKIEGDSI